MEAFLTTPRPAVTLRAMSRAFVLTVVACVVLAGRDAEAQTRAIRFGQLWDGAEIVRDAVVVVDGDRIRAVGQGRAAIPPGATVVDLRPLVGLPGLIDAHTHITYFWDRAPGTRPRGQRRLPAVSCFLAHEKARTTREPAVIISCNLRPSNDR